MSDFLDASETLGSSHVSKFLAHYGKKGMRWGVRRMGNSQKIADRLQTKADAQQARVDRREASGARFVGPDRRAAKRMQKNADSQQKFANKLATKQDKKWEKSIYTDKGAVAVHNTVARDMNDSVIPKLNNNPKYKDKNLYDDPELEKSYYKDYGSQVNQAYSRAVTKVHGSSPSGKKEAIYRPETDNLPALIEVRDKNVTHADSAVNEPDLVFFLRKDDNGQVVETNEASSDISHGEDFTDTFLAHYGKKGMKWGVRNDTGHEGEAVKTSKLKKLDKKWEKENTGMRGIVKVHNAAADRMNNGEIEKLNNIPKFKEAADKGHFLDDNHPTTREYLHAYSETVARVMLEESVKLGANPSGTKQYEVVDVGKSEDGNTILEARLSSVKRASHADGLNEGDVQYELKRNAKGVVTGMALRETYFAHYGVPGMKWGKTKSEGPTPVTTVATPGRRVQATGGTNQPAHPDAIKTAAAKRKAKASTVDSLSNEELQNLVKRIQLEQQFSKLTYQPSKLKKGYNFISGAVGVGRTVNEVMAFQNSPAGKQLDDAFKKQKNKNRGEEE